MKVVIFGASGFVGSYVLRQCIMDGAISSIVVISRRDIEPSYQQNHKVRCVLHQNFLEYPQSILETFSDARACFWCIGGRHTQTSRWPTYEDYVHDSVELPLAAARVFATSVAPSLAQKPFRFIFCSGDSTELDPSKSLWIMGTTRKVKGKAEKGLYELADQCPTEFEAYSARPCGIYSPNPNIKERLLTTFVLPSLRVEALAATMVYLAKEGYDQRIVDHKTAKELGERLLEKEKEGNI
ncbi:hypothetical protein NA57DRAFT_76876 [Rhizodiscina lignyota]|uniref:NAD-dependent epimerase/dehydratase domain-containing protein n=1 Tax=Rhizodiscina lignyota TaxID=1504668 RepID=A0A9P4M5P6_9PEZI|nr:hypothetical protein NA57DRAFT_76876 [Rhizodiscina lignyota]